MADDKIRFEDGAGYERMMGTWSRIAGERFLDWVRPAPGLSWVDVGCGNGAFTHLIVDRCAPAGVVGVDPASAQLDYARARGAGAGATFTQGDAQALPLPDASFDAAVMALVIFFVPDPARGVAEMARVTKPGGTVCAYAWDILGGGFPLHAVQEGMRASGMAPPYPPSVEAASIANLIALWEGAGLVDVRTTTYEVQREFTGFEEYWEIAKLGSSVGGKLRSMSPEAVAALKESVRQSAFKDAGGPCVVTARANAVTGRVASR